MADEKGEVYNELIDFISEKMSEDFAIQTLGECLIVNLDSGLRETDENIEITG